MRNNRANFVILRMAYLCTMSQKWFFFLPIEKCFARHFFYQFSLAFELTKSPPKSFLNAGTWKLNREYFNKRGSISIGDGNVNVKQFFSIKAQGERESTSRRIKSSCSNGKILSHAEIHVWTPDIRDAILTWKWKEAQRMKRALRFELRSFINNFDHCGDVYLTLQMRRYIW